MTPKFKPPGTKRLKPKCDILLSSFAIKFNLRRYTEIAITVTLNGVTVDTVTAKLVADDRVVGRCRLTVSKPVLTAPIVSVLEARI